MQAHILESPQRQTTTSDAVASRYPVTAVGTFAAGQSPQGSFHVVADAKLGNFASELTTASALATSDSALAR